MPFQNMENNAYGPANKPLVGAWIFPDRWSLSMFRYSWPFIRGGVILLILAGAFYPVIGWFYTLLSIGLYIAWYLVASLIQLKPRHTQQMNFVRHLAPILFVFPLIAIGGRQVESLWLLYFVPMLTVGLEISRGRAVLVILLDFLAVLASSIYIDGFPATLTTSWLLTGLQYSLLKAVMVSYVGITSYFLSRSLAYIHQVNKRLLDLLPRIASEPYGWQDAAKEVVQKVSDSFSDWQNRMVVNILTLYHDKLFLTASSLASGQALVTDHFNFSNNVGITGSVAQNGCTRFINDVKKDPEHLYYPHPAFPNIRAELAVPVKIGEQVVAVIDIESQRKNAFGDEDRQAMEFIAAHLAEIFRQTHLLGRYKKLADLSNGLATKIFGIRDLGQLLEEIGKVATEVLDAQLIGYYFRDPQSGITRGPYTAGHVKYPELSRTKLQPNRLVESLFLENEIKLYDEAQQSLELIGTPEREHGYPPFVIREEIISCAVVPLKVRAETIGLMFINYRRKEKFSKELQDMIEIIAPLAALAIQSAIQEDASIMLRRQKVINELHDTVSHKILATKISLEKLEKLPPSSQEWKEQLVAAEKYIQSANRMVYDLTHNEDVDQLRSATLKAVLEELNSDAGLIRRVFEMDVQVDSQGISEESKSLPMRVEVQHVIDEALYNAARHSHARLIRVQLGLAESMLTIQIQDDGVGFDPKLIKLGTGLYQLRSKVQYSLKGSMEIDTRPGQGTCLTFRLPMRIENKGNEQHGK